MIRTFLALIIPDHVKDYLFEQRRELIDDDINFRWEPKEKIHVTLKFIGEINEEILPDLISDLIFLESFNKIKCEINKFGFFFHNDIPRILWASLIVDPAINEIMRKLDDKLSLYGIKKEKRRFKPHLTLLRLKKDPGADFIGAFNRHKLGPVKFGVDRIVLYKSELYKSGSKYFEIKNYNLN
jgi:2'-5' RNA ligase